MGASTFSDGRGSENAAGGIVDDAVSRRSSPLATRKRGERLHIPPDPSGISPAASTERVGRVVGRVARDAVQLPERTGMSIYVYRYSEFPDGKSDKYYVGNYRKGNAYTYQVVPQLQLQFDREGRGERTELDWERFKRLRSRGLLYTANRDDRRSPLHPEVDPSAVGEDWRRLAHWLAGESAPAEVDWEALGAELRAKLEAGLALPDSLRRSAKSIDVGDGETLAEVWERVRREHLRACWFHLVDERTVDELSVVDERDWSTLSSRFDGGQPVGEAATLRDVVRETRPRRAPEESTFLRELSEAWGEPIDSWSEASERLGDLEARYETVDVGETRRIPDERLYDAHWLIGGMLDACRLHHPAATARFPGHGGALHARFHAGASRAIQMRLASYPAALRADRVESEFEREARGGVFDDWSDEGLTTVARWLVDPDADRVAAGSPAAEIVTEVCAWHVDERAARAAQRAAGDETRWRYSRCGDEMVVSSTEEADREEMKRVRRAVAEAVDGGDGGGLVPDDVRFWREARARLELECGFVVPPAADGRLRLPLERRHRVRSVLQDVAQGTVLADERRRKAGAVHPVVGDLRCGTCGDPAIADAVADLVGGLAMTDFYEAFRRGWFSRRHSGWENLGEVGPRSSHRMDGRRGRTR